MKEVKRSGGKYQSSLGPDLMPLRSTKDVAEQLTTTTTTADKQQHNREPTKVPGEPNSNVVPNMFGHLKQFETLQRPRPPSGGGHGAAHCIFTGDLFTDIAQDEDKIRSVVTQKPLPVNTYAPPKRCIFTGDDLPPTQALLRRPPETPKEVWLSARAGPDDADWRPSSSSAVSSAELQRLREWKTRCVMPETLDGIGGFAPPILTESHPDPNAHAHWQNERAARAWADQADKEGSRLSRERAALEVANRPQSEYGERRLSRRRGEVFSPFAPRA